MVIRVADIIWPNTVGIVALSVPFLPAFIILLVGDRQWTSLVCVLCA